MLKRRCAPAMAALVLLSVCTLGSAQAYEFEVKARSYGQAYGLRSPSLLGGRIARRRITQSLQLHLWDLAGSRDGLSIFAAKLPTGPRIYFSSYIRLDQDYGAYTTDQLLVDGVVRDAVDVIPELERSSLQFDLLYAYAGAEGLAGGAVDVFAGRLMEVETLDWFSMDGLKLRLHASPKFTLEAFGGVRVRETSILGSSAMAPDGSSGALCEEYVEGPLAGSGSWRPIDGLPPRQRSPFTSDDEYCPQREALMPTWGGAIQTQGFASIVGRLSYRRSQSRSVRILGIPDRLDYEDVGYYPNERGQTPEWGINEERVALSVRAPQKTRSGVRLMPYAAARYSLLHGLVDEAHLGMRAGRASHDLEAELFYSFPSFEGDSIFNVFSAEPYTDARTTYHYRPRDAALGGFLRAWGRRYHSEDAEQSLDPGLASANEYAGGLQLGGRYDLDRMRHIRLDGFHEDGYGGLRSGGALSSLWHWSRTTRFTGRVSVIHYDEDLRPDLEGYNLSAQLGTRYLINDGFAASLLIEENTSRHDRFQLAAFFMLDLAFQPET